MTSHTPAPGAALPRAAIFISLGIGVAACLVLAAGGPGHASEREHGAHVHGVGQMNLAVEGKEVEIELTAPGADIVGFEHAAETDADRKAVVAATEKLKKALALFSFPVAAKCELEEAEVHTEMMDGHGDGNEKRHDHGKDHAHEKEHDHGKEHAPEKKHDHEERHAEFRAHYHFECGALEALSHIDVSGYFRSFPNARELEVQSITAKGQGAGELTAANPRLTF